jgi:hypothetical protein
MKNADSKSNIYPPEDFLSAQIEAEKRDDGTIILRSPVPLGKYPRCLGPKSE